MRNKEDPPGNTGGTTTSIGRRALVPIAFFVFVGGVLGLGATIHQQARVADHRGASENLVATSQLSALAVNTWVNERFADAEAISTSDLLVSALTKIEAGNQTAADTQAVQNHLNNLRRLYSYTSIALLHSHRPELMLSNGRAINPEQRDVIARLDAYRKPLWVELPVADPVELRMGLVRGVVGSGNATPWLLYLEIQPEWLITTLRLAHPRNWAGENLLLHRDRTGTRFLSFETGPRLQPLPAVKAGQGRDPVPLVEGLLFAPDAGQREGPNREGQSVLARAEPVNLPGWMLYSEIPLSAVYIADERTQILMFGMGALLLLGTLALLAWRRGDRHKAQASANRMRQTYEGILRNSAEIFVLAHSSGKIMDVNHAAAAAYGYTRRMMIGMQARALRVSGPDGELDSLIEGLQPDEMRPFVEERVRMDGSRFILEGTVGMIQFEGETYYCNIGRDVTRQRQTESQLRVAASFFERSAAAIVISDSNRHITKINPAVTQITGYTIEDLQGQPTVIFNAGLDPETLAIARECLAREDHWEGEMRGRRKDGTVFPARFLLSNYRGADGAVVESVGVFTDLSKLKSAEQRAEHLALHDHLTGLPNRLMLDRELPDRILSMATPGKQRAGNSLTLVLLNLDRVKSINESLGHNSGDRLIKEVASRLVSVSPDPKSLYRYGGDEFLFVMEGNPVTHALFVSQVRALPAPHVHLGEHPVTATASIGIACFPDHASTAEALIRNVESAMRNAKANGRNTWRVYEPEMNASAFEDMLLAVELRQAVDAGHLELFLQAQYTIKERALVGTEALLRWTHATRGPVSPGRFIPIAESSGMIGEISRWVLREAARIWSSWREQGLVPVPIAVNLSAIQFQDPEFVPDVAQVIAEFSLPPGALQMELTESIIMGDTEAAIQRMIMLVEMGIQLAIDDFGTGYSSLAYLNRFPVRKLKIDRSFVMELGREGNQEGAAITSAIIAMAKALKLKVIAEGMETQQQRDFLEEQGCDEVQGYLYGKPIPVASVTPLLLKEPRARRSAGARGSISLSDENSDNHDRAS